VSGVATCCPPADPVYVAIRAIIWLNQVASVVGRLMKPQELERVYAAALSVPITDPCADILLVLPSSAEFMDSVLSLALFCL
jgi:hypothetical protein